MSKHIPTSYWGWIPTFTHRINFTRCVNIKKRVDPWTKLDKNEEEYICETILKQYLNCDLNEILKGEDYEIYSKEHHENDTPGETDKFLHILFVDKENKIPYVLCSKYKEKVTEISKEDILCFGKIEYVFNKNKNNIPTGLIKTEIIYPSCLQETNTFECKKLHDEIYVCVRDIYHDHLFHHDGEDFLLKNVEAPDKTEATKQIINLFEDKIQEYMHTLDGYTPKELYSCSFEELKGFVKVATRRIVISKNGMIYARRFIELADMEEPARSLLEKVFMDAYNSFEDFNKRIVTTYEIKGMEETIRLTQSLKDSIEETTRLTQSLKNSMEKTGRMTKWLVRFTVFVGVLTLIMAIDAGLRIIMLLK